MGFGIGKFLRRITTPPKGSALRKVFGNSVLDELGTGLGFAFGGPAGASLGSAAGHAAADNKHATLGGALRNAAKGYAVGQGAHMAGVPGNGALAGRMGSMGIPGGGSGGALSRLGGIPRGALDYFTDPEQGLARTQLALGGAQLGAQYMGARQEGELMDRQYAKDEEEERRRREAANSYSSSSYNFGGA